MSIYWMTSIDVNRFVNRLSVRYQGTYGVIEKDRQSTSIGSSIAQHVLCIKGLVNRFVNRFLSCHPARSLENDLKHYFRVF